MVNVSAMTFLKNNLKVCVYIIIVLFNLVSGDDAEDAKNVHTKYCEKPSHKYMHLSNFTQYRNILIDPEDSFLIEPNWVIYERGSSVIQTTNSDPALAINYHYFKGLDFDGSFFVDTDLDDDYFGLVFGFENSKSFYAIMWKKANQNFWYAKPNRATAETGVQIKLIKSASGLGPILRNALWNTESTDNEVKLLWKDPNKLGWKNKTPYEWKLIHRPAIGLIKLEIFQEKKCIVKTTIFDSTIQGGRVGLLAYSQEMVIWSDMRYRCSDNLPKNIHSELPPGLQGKINVEQ